MPRNPLLIALLVAATATAHAFSFTLTPITVTSPTNASPIYVNGVVTVASNETFYSPTMMSTAGMPFLPGFTAGFNGPGQSFTSAFLSWSGVGTYTGPVYQFAVNPGNLGYSGGMPQGLYSKNPFGPGGNAFITLNVAGPTGQTVSATATYAIQVVPESPAVIALGLGLVGLGLRRRGR